MLKNRFVRLGIAGVVTLVFGLVANYVAMPAWNFRADGMWWFLFIVFLAGTIVSGIIDSKVYSDPWNTVGFAIPMLLCALVLFAGFISSNEAINHEQYRNMISIEEGNFSEDVPAVGEETPIAIVDMSTAQKLGDRTIGSIPNATWYEVDNEYNMIKYREGYYRISPLNYGGLFKYNDAKSQGIPGFVLVNTENQDSKYEALKDSIRYSPSGHFEHLLARHLRNAYPSYIFGKSFFEIDEEGAPYYITSVQTPTIGIFGGLKVTSFIVTNAVTGANAEYAPENLPEWIEHAYSLDYMMTLVNYHYLYVNGWFNSFTSMTGVYRTTYEYAGGSFAGYNTLIDANGDIVFCTGVTPASGAETNVGFLLLNSRTGKAKYYACAGAEESSSQIAAEALVKNMQYSASFPTILNVDGVETYYMLLKDQAGLVQGYALCNIKDYTKVVWATTFEEAVSLYKQKLVGSTVSPSDTLTAEGVISSLYQAQIDGYTYFFFQLNGSSDLYMSSITNSSLQVLLDVGSNVAIEYVASSEDGVWVVTKIQC